MERKKQLGTEAVPQAEAARRLGVSRKAITTAIRNGTLAPVYGGVLNNRTVGVTVASLETVIRRRRDIEAKRENAKGGVA